MKKGLGILLVSVFTLVLCGCGGNKVLECSTTTSSYGINATINLKANFKGNEITNMSTETVATVSDTYLPYMNTFVESFKETYDTDTYKQEGITTEVTSDDKAIYANVYYDLAKMSDEAKENLNMSDVYGTYDATRDAMIEQGYTCK